MYVHSQVPMKTLTSHSTNSAMVALCKEAIQIQSESEIVYICYVQGDTVTEGNEIAGELAEGQCLFQTERSYKPSNSIKGSEVKARSNTTSELRELCTI